MNGRWKVPLLIRAIAGAYAAVGIVLIYFDARLRFTPIWSQVTTVAYVLLAVILVNLPAVRKSLGFTPLGDVASATFADAIKSIASGLAGFGAVIMVINFFPDTRLTAAVVLISILGFVSVSAYFFGRIVWRFTQLR